MATRRHYIDHDDTKPREKNEYYEVREYNVDENVMGKYWRESGKPARYQDLSRQQTRNQRQRYKQQRYDFQWQHILGVAVLALFLFTLKPPSGNITVTAGSAIPSPDGKSVTITATIENTSGAVLLDLQCVGELRDSEGNVFSKNKVDVAAYVFPGIKKTVSVTIPTAGHTGTYTARVEAKGRHIVWGII